MKKNILICGQAGQGINFTSLLLGRALINAGFYVFIYRDYGSLIRGGHNFNVISFSDKPIFSHQNIFQAIIDLDGSSIDHESDFSPDAFVLNKESLEQITDDEKSNDPKQINNALLGMILKIWGIPLDHLSDTVKEKIKPWKDIVLAAEKGYKIGLLRENLKTKKTASRFFTTGTNGLALGAIVSGLDVYLSYPMTPSTGLLIELAKRAQKNKLLVSQMEDEITVINAALGASYAGAKTMIGTSGGGFALMTEAISLSGMAEIPIVIYLSQRTGPSTGVPTYTAQGDLNFARFAGHGEFPKIVVAPGNPEEAVGRTIESFYLAHKYRLPVILLSDKHLSESYYTFDEVNYPKVKFDDFIARGSDKNKQNYSFDQIVSERIIPGRSDFARANSYEHDQYGETVEDSKTIEKMNNRRLMKMDLVQKEVNDFQPAKIWGRGSNLIISWGSTQGAIIDCLPELTGYRFLQISYIHPFPKEMVRREIEKSNKVILVENNATGLLGQLLAMETGYLVDKKILKCDGRPFTADELINRVKEIS